MESTVLVLGALVGSLAVLIIGAERFTHCAEKIGISMGLPGFIVGVLIISLGTSLPEMISSIFAV
ncbi:MAG: sodium:calcium antiporter, partial [Desulfobacterales bacterium]|nr:sodium:calcium antiporter [Desulfobacterales bacterium]